MDYRRRRKRLFSRALRVGSMTSADAADMLGISRQAAAHLLQRLHRNGWLRRRRTGEGSTYEYTPSQRLHECYRTYPTG